MKGNTQGFTLIELLIVIAIIGILAAVLIPNLLGARQRAYDTAAQSCAKAIATGEETYQIDSNTYTSVLANLTGVNTCDTAKMTITPVAASTTDSTYLWSVSHNQGKKNYTVSEIGIK